MKIARVTGTVVSTVKYEKYRGYKLLKVRHLTLEGEMTGEELIALDAADAGIGDIVLVNNDGGAAQMITGDKTLIASDTICGVVDCYTWQGKHVAATRGKGMNIGKVVGSVVCTVKTPTLEGIKLLVVRQIVNGQEKGLIIACDGTRQAGIGDVVYMIGRKEAALMLDLKDPPPSDITIAGIIDPETL